MRIAQEEMCTTRQASIVFWNRLPLTDCADSVSSVEEAVSSASKNRLARDRTQLFHKRFTFFAVVDYECVVVSMRGPWAARYFARIHKLPFGHVCFFQSEVVAHGRRNIEARAFVEIRLWAFVAEHVLPVVGAEWACIFPLRISSPVTFANGDPSTLAS